jgi:hypothetical protein
VGIWFAVFGQVPSDPIFIKGNTESQSHLRAIRGQPDVGLVLALMSSSDGPSGRGFGCVVVKKGLGTFGFGGLGGGF